MKQEKERSQASTSTQKEEVVQSITDYLTKKCTRAYGREDVLDANSETPDAGEMPALSSEYQICRVPERLRRVKEEAYTPRCVSIGPFHHGNKTLKNMEYDKLRYLTILLHRPSAKPLKQYVQMLLECESRARDSYDEALSYSKKEFVEMMLLDGCFIVELFRKYYYHSPEIRNERDRIFKNKWIFNAIHRDLLLLENQLPFFVLENLFTLIHYPSTEKQSFIKLTESFLCHYNPIRINGISSSPYPDKIEHLVRLLWHNFTSGLTSSHKKTDKPNLVYIPSATGLLQVGIKFKGTDFKATPLLKVEFRDGLLTVPTLLVDHRTESLFRNLIAFEQSHSRSTAIGPGKHEHGPSTTLISDYVTLMDCLINTPADVALLRDKGIIHNHLGDDKEVALLLNKLRNGTITCSSTNGFHYCDIFEAVNAYYGVKWHGTIATLKREYFNTPWAKISFGAAFVLLACTAIQTVYAVRFHN